MAKLLNFLFVFRPWEHKHGSLDALQLLVPKIEEKAKLQDLRSPCVNLLSHEEVRVRQSAGES